jgi:hypothetical protein
MAVKITSRFATAMDTADALGVSRARAAKLIKLLNSVRESRKKNGYMRSKTTGSLKRKTSKRQTRARISKAAR